ncbi:MAG: cation:proton antiporter [Cyanobacteria bacterium P01_E01_bin.45]
MEQSFTLTSMMVLVLVAGIGAQVLANIVKVPSIVFLLVFGVVLGPDMEGWVSPESLGVGIEVIVALSVALILFEGGLNLNLQTLGRVSKSLWRLVSLGAAITLMGGAVAAHYLGEFPWRIAFIYSSLVVVTGPTVINPILKRVRVSESLSTLLEGEGVLIDPIGAILAVVVLNLALAGTPNSEELFVAAVSLLGSLAVGAAIGAVGGFCIGQLLKRSQKLLGEELINSVVLAGALGIYVLSQSLLNESGLMAAVTAGIVVRQVAEFRERQVRRFQGQLVLLAISVLFILLTANLSLQSVLLLGWGAVGTVAVLMFVVRPLSIWLCTWGGELTWREKVFAAWMAPRGIVAASVSSLFALVLTEREIAGGEAVKALVFLTIATTVILQGLSAGLVAKLLGLNEGGTTVVVGNNGVVLQLADLLHGAGQSVTAIAHQQVPVNAPSASATAPKGSTEGFEAEPELEVVYGNALDPVVLANAGVEHAETLVAITLNSEVNQAIAELATSTYDVPHVLAALKKGQENVSEEVQDIIGGSKAIAEWNNFLNSEAVHVKVLQLPLKDKEGVAAIWKAQIVSRAVSNREPVSDSEPEDNRLRPGAKQTQSLPSVSSDNHRRLVNQLTEFIRSDYLLAIALRRRDRFELFPHSSTWQPGDEVFFLEREASAISIQYKPIAPVSQTKGSVVDSYSLPLTELQLQPES